MGVAHLCHRVGYLYGKFNEDSTVKVELIYEPPQETTDTTFTILPDSKEVRIVLVVGVVFEMRFQPV